MESLGQRPVKTIGQDYRVLMERFLPWLDPSRFELCGVPSERIHLLLSIPRALPWADMRCPLGQVVPRFGMLGL
jgi:hypothetical protein